MSAMKFHVGDRVEDKKLTSAAALPLSTARSSLETSFIAVLFNGHDEALDVPADSVRKVSTRQS